MGMGHRSRLSSSTMRTLHVCGQYLTIQPGHSDTQEKLPSWIGHNILTVSQYSPTWQQQGWASTRSMGRSKRGLGCSWLSSKLPGALAMPSMDSVPEQQTHPRHISSNTRRLT